VSNLLSYVAEMKLIDGRGRSLPELQALTRRRVVLVVDDEPAVLERLVRAVHSENYDIVVASNGPEAIAKADQETAVDLLVTDYDNGNDRPRARAAATRAVSRLAGPLSNGGPALQPAGAHRSRAIGSIRRDSATARLMAAAPVCAGAPVETER